VPLRFPKVIGHRGCAQRAPENTLAGFRKAAALGCRFVELDARLTLEGEVVVIHDGTLERTTDGAGPVGATSLADLRARDAGSHFDPSYRGERIPTLNEALVLLRELGLGVDVELKTDAGRERALAEAVARAIERTWPRELPLLATSFSGVAIEALARQAPDIPRGYLVDELPADWRARLSRLGAVAAIVDHKTLTSDLVRAVKRAGTPLLAYTVNHPSRAAELFAWGVDGAFSDVPDTLIDVLKIRP
jgi:glycerophosphoryl diester phosphodiesterase